MPGGKNACNPCWSVGVALLLGGATLLAGCSSSVPRYRSVDKESPAVIQEDDEFHYVTKIRTEETREDDKKVDLKKVTKDLTAKRQTSGRYSNLTPKGLNRDELLLGVVGYLGVPYSYGEQSREGMDCSAFTAQVYADAVRRTLPRSTRDQFQIGSEVTPDDLQFGDLVFFNTTGYSPSHVGIYIEDDLFVHASVTYGVTISSLESTYYRKRFIGARRVFD